MCNTKLYFTLTNFEKKKGTMSPEYVNVVPGAVPPGLFVRLDSQHSPPCLILMSESNVVIGAYRTSAPSAKKKNKMKASHMPNDICCHSHNTHTAKPSPPP